MLRFVLTCLLLVTGLSAARADAPRVSMSASTNRVAVGEPFAVEIRIETHGDDPDSVELPDFGSLQVLGRSTARPFSFSFGMGQQARVKSETIYGFTLRATEIGAFSIRPAIITFKGRRIASQPLNIAAVEGSTGRGGMGGMVAPGALQAPHDQGGDDGPPPAAEGQPLDGAKPDANMFLRTVVDKKRAALGEQVTVTIYLYLRGQLGDSPSITREPTLDGFWSIDLLPMQRSLSATRQDVDGRSYSVYVLRRFAAFPLRDGRLEIGAPAVEVGAGGSIFDLLNGPGRPTRREGVKVAVEVAPLPPQPDRGQPTFTGALSLDATLDVGEAKVGEAVTLRVLAKGRGNLSALQLPTPKLPDVDVLAPEIDDHLGHQQDIVGGERTFRWLLLPRAAAELTVPGFVVNVYDPSSGQFTAARSAALKLRVSGASAEPKAAVDDAAVGDPSQRFGPVRNESALERRSVALDRLGFYWPTVFAAPLLLLAFYGVRTARQRLAARLGRNADDLQRREIDERLEQARKAAQGGDANATLSALSSALKKAVEARIHEPVGGMTLRALEAHLQKRALDPQLAGRVIAQLGALERARFDPGSQGALELNHALEGVRTVVQDLGRGKRGAA